MFSILLPTYKPNFLKECIDSVLAQTYTEFELIIVNDASPYDIDSIVNQYDDKRIRYYKNEKNYGAVDMVKNWNHCLEYATGNYVINMGDDDKLAKDCLENYVNLIQKYPNYDLYHTRMAIINENSEIIELQESRPEKESVYSMIWHYWKGRRQVIGDWLFKTKTLRENKGFYDLPCAWASDDLSAFTAAKNTGVINSEKIGFYYRQTNKTVSSKNSFAPQKVEALYMAGLWYKEFLKAEPNDEIDKFYRNSLRKNLNNKVSSWILYEIKGALNSDAFAVFYWIRKCNNYKISRFTIIHTQIIIIKDKILGFFRSLR